MDMIRATVYRVKLPTAMLTSFSDLLFDGAALFRVQATCILGHSRRCFEFPHRVGKLPATLILDPAPGIARQPCAVGDPCQEIADWIAHMRVILAPTARMFFRRGATAPSLTLRVTISWFGRDAERSCDFVEQLVRDPPAKKEQEGQLPNQFQEHRHPGHGDPNAIRVRTSLSSSALSIRSRVASPYPRDRTSTANRPL